MDFGLVIGGTLDAVRELCEYLAQLKTNSANGRRARVQITIGMGVHIHLVKK